MPSRALLVSLASAFLGLIAPPWAAAGVTPGAPTTSIPSSLIDPLGSLVSPLPADEFLLPIEITSANGLQDWSFDLNFDDSIVTPLDAGGLFQSAYQAAFNATDPTPSNITTSGFLLPGVLQGIAGFSSGVSGDGLLAYILFEFQPGQQDPFPEFSISNESTSQAPEPATLALLAGGLVLVGRLVRPERRS